jgi:hypothetical protein
MNSAIKLVGITVGTTTRRSKSKRLPACTILASSAMLYFNRGFISDRTRVMVYSSRRRFRMDNVSDVGRNLFSASQLCTCTQGNADLPLPDTQRHIGRYRRDTIKVSAHPYLRKIYTVLTLIGRVRDQQLLHTGLEGKTRSVCIRGTLA